MTTRQALIERTANRLLSSRGYEVYDASIIRRALDAEGWAGPTNTSTAAHSRLLGDVQRAARAIYSARITAGLTVRPIDTNTIPSGPISRSHLE